MNKLYSSSKLFWNRLPESIKNIVRFIEVLNKIKHSIKELIIQRTSFDEIYDDDFFTKIQTSKVSINAIANSIIKHFQPLTLLDVGCGTGDLIENLRSRGVNVFGLERAETALKICMNKSLDVLKFDIERDRLPKFEKIDVVVSMEVAEHLPESCAEHYVALLCEKTKVVVFTAATPGQGGDNHINEQPHQYWIDKFIKYGFKFDESLSLQLRYDWKLERVPDWYYRNIMIFKRIPE